MLWAPTFDDLNPRPQRILVVVTANTGFSFLTLPSDPGEFFVDQPPGLSPGWHGPFSDSGGPRVHCAGPSQSVAGGRGCASGEPLNRAGRHQDGEHEQDDAEMDFGGGEQAALTHTDHRARSTAPATIVGKMAVAAAVGAAGARIKAPTASSV